MTGLGRPRQVDEAIALPPGMLHKGSRHLGERGRSHPVHHLAEFGPFSGKAFRKNNGRSAAHSDQVLVVVPESEIVASRQAA